MNKENIIRAKLLPDGSVVQVLPDGTTCPLTSQTDWARLGAMTDAEIEAAALSDPDAQPLTEEELAQFRRVSHHSRARRTPQEAAAHIRELRKGNTLGGLKIKDLIHE